MPSKVIRCYKYHEHSWTYLSIVVGIIDHLARHFLCHRPFDSWNLPAFQRFAALNFRIWTCLEWIQNAFSYIDDVFIYSIYIYILMSFLWLAGIPHICVYTVYIYIFHNIFHIYIYIPYIYIYVIYIYMYYISIYTYIYTHIYIYTHTLFIFPIFIQDYRHKRQPSASWPCLWVPLCLEFQWSRCREKTNVGVSHHGSMACCDVLKYV